jgi:hypothetical protein
VRSGNKNKTGTNVKRCLRGVYVEIPFSADTLETNLRRLQPYDMNDAQFRFVFAGSFVNATAPCHVGIVSPARLAVDPSTRPNTPAPSAPT